MKAWLFAAIFAVGAVQPANADATATSPVRIFLVVDNSGSMAAGRRLARARDMARRAIGALPVPSATTVEIATASDEVTPLGVFALRTDTDRAAALAAIDGVRIRRGSRTSYRAIDRALSALIAARTQPHERVGFAILTDGKTDEPGTDLPARALGERANCVNGVVVVMAGHLPSTFSLGHPSGPRRPVGELAGGSRLRALLAPALAVTAPPAVEATPRARLFGGYEQVTLEVTVSNRGAFGRAVDLDVAAPDGARAAVEPKGLVVRPCTDEGVLVRIAATRAMSEDVIVKARGPEGNMVEATVLLTINPSTWAASNWQAIVALGLAALVGLASLAWLRRRPARIGPIGQPGRAAILKRGDEIPLSVFDGAFPTGSVLRRGWSGFAVRTDGAPLAISAVPVRPRRWTAYALRQSLECDAATLVLDIVCVGAPVRADPTHQGRTVGDGLF